MLDVVVVGCGIVGASIARSLLRRSPRLALAVVEREESVARGQTGHNSGVIHAGVYYPEGSLRAKMCVQGARDMYDFAAAKGIAAPRVGKMIVATSEAEEERMLALRTRAENNGVTLETWTGTQVTACEPHVVGRAALWSPNTGIIDWAQVCRAMADDVRAADHGRVVTSFDVRAIDVRDDRVILTSAAGERLEARNAVLAPGLHADRIAQLAGGARQPAIVPFRGRYLGLVGKRIRIRTNVYPVPDPAFPWLGVHFTPTVDGRVIIGPNATLATKREGYSYADVSPRDVADALAHRGLQKLLVRNVRYGLTELAKDLVPALAVADLRRYVPALTRSDVVQHAHVGVRALAMTDAGMVDDFVFETVRERVLAVRNAPSPAATSSLAIGEAVAERAHDAFGLA